MTHKAKPILIVVGAILIAMFPLSRWIASEYLRNAPRVYFSAVTIEIKPDTFSKGDPPDSGRIDPQFLATQFQVIKKSEILNPVIEKLDLVKKLSPPGMTMPMQWVTEVLSRSIVVQEQRNTTLIEIGVYHPDKRLAADIANTVVITYCDKRIEELRRNNDQILTEMRDEISAREEKMATLSSEASRILQEDNIVDPDPENSNTILSLTTEPDEGVSKIFPVENRASVKIRNQLARIEELKPEELMEALRMLSIRIVGIEQTLALLQNAKAEEAKFLSEGFAENNSRVESVRADHKICMKFLNDELESIKRSLKTKLGIEETTLKSYEVLRESRRKMQNIEKTRLSRYLEKKSSYLMTRQLVVAMRQRYVGYRIEFSSEVPVKIRQRAEPAQTPARPDVIAVMQWANVVGGSFSAIGVLLVLIAARSTAQDVRANTNPPMNPGRKD